MRSAAILLVLTLCAAGGRAADAPGVRLPPALARVLADYESAWQRKDAAALAALFTEDGFVLSGGSAPVRGRAAIAAHYEGKGGPLALRALAYSIEGEGGSIVGAYGRERGAPDDGKFTLTLRKRGGRWLIFSDMDNGNARTWTTPADREALAAADASWNALRVKADVSGLSKLLADDFLLTHSDGRLQDKAAYLADLTTRARTNDAIANEDVSVRVYGAVGVVTGTSVQSGTRDGAPWGGRFRFTRVWTRRGEAWTMVASHSSRIEAPAP
jgi:ketosteroid isomerase-like protein